MADARSNGFDEWYRQLTIQARIETSGERAEKLRQWFQQLYQSRGAIPLEECWAAMLMDEMPSPEMPSHWSSPICTPHRPNRSTSWWTSFSSVCGFASGRGSACRR